MPRLSPGDEVPDVAVDPIGGPATTLLEAAAQYERGLIIYFYPAAGTPGCTKQACDFRDNLASLQSHGYGVIGISPDKTAKLQKFAESEGLDFPLIPDPEHELLEAFGAWGEKKNYGRTYVGVIRSTIVVDPEGVVTLAQYNVRASGHVSKLRRDLEIDPK